MYRFFLAAFLAALPLAVSAATVAPSVLLGTPSTYDGQTVTVTGTVQSYKSKDTAMGKWTAYQLCDSKCIFVIDKTQATHADGSTATVTGVFHATFQGPHKTWNNALVVGT